MQWKEDWADHKEQTGLTWAEYHAEYFVHQDELSDLRAEIDDLTTHVEATKNSYQQLARELHEIRVLAHGDLKE